MTDRLEGIVVSLAGWARTMSAILGNCGEVFVFKPGP